MQQDLNLAENMSETETEELISDIEVGMDQIEADIELLSGEKAKVQNANTYETSALNSSPVLPSMKF